MTYSNTTRMGLVKVDSGTGQTVDHAATLSTDMDMLDDAFVEKIVTSTTRPALGSSFDGQLIYESDSFCHLLDDGTAWTYFGGSRYGTDKDADVGITLNESVSVFVPIDGTGGVSRGDNWTFLDPTTVQFEVAGYFYVGYGWRINEVAAAGGTIHTAIFHLNSAGSELNRYERVTRVMSGNSPFTSVASIMMRVAKNDRLRVRLFQNTTPSIATDGDFGTAMIDISFIRPLLGLNSL